MNLISSFNALWGIATIEERKQWDEDGNGSEVIRQLETQLDDMCNQYHEILSYVVDKHETRTRHEQAIYIITLHNLGVSSIGTQVKELTK